MIPIVRAVRFVFHSKTTYQDYKANSTYRIVRRLRQSSNRIRKLTPRECGRLMGVSDEDISKMAAVNSNTQLYKQLRNKTSGSQGEGKAQIDDYRPQKGYRDGLAQGRKNTVRELKNIIDKHLIVSIKPENANNKVSQKQFEKFKEILGKED